MALNNYGNSFLREVNIMVMSMCEMKTSGYGLVSKKIMLDSEISCTSKAIYSYFCSLSGNKGISFPSIKKILRDLNLNKRTFLKHLKQLKDKKYIETENKLFSNTTYVVLKNDEIKVNRDTINHNYEVQNLYHGAQKEHERGIDHVQNKYKSSECDISECNSSECKKCTTINNNIVSNNSISNNNINNNINLFSIEEESTTNHTKKANISESKETNLNLKSYDSKHSASEKPMEYESIKKEFDVVPSKVKVPSNDADDKLVLLISDKDKETLKEFMTRCNLSNELFNSMYQYIVNRNLRKKGMSYGALRLLIANLKKIAPTIEMQREILDQSTINCWNNVYPIKEPPCSVPPPYAFGGKPRHGTARWQNTRAFTVDKDGNCPLVDEEKVEVQQADLRNFLTLKSKEKENQNNKSKKRKQNNKVRELIRC